MKNGKEAKRTFLKIELEVISGNNLYIFLFIVKEVEKLATTSAKGTP